MTQINAQALQYCVIKNQLIPDEGPKAAGTVLDFETNPSYALDATIMQQLGYLSMIQTMWVDAADIPVGQSVQMDIGTTNQRIVILGGTAGYYNVLCPNPPRIQFTISAIGAGSILRLQFINIPIPGVVFSTV